MSDLELEVEDLFLAAPASQGAVFQAELEGAHSYVCRQRVSMRGGLDERVFTMAVSALFSRHAALRSAFDLGPEGRITQVVYRDVGTPLVVEDWRERAPEEQARALNALESEDLTTGFQSTVPPLIRFRLVRLEAQRWELAISFFHGLLDGWSTHLLIEDLWRNYHAIARGEVPPPMPPPYQPYARWLVARDPKADIAYWTEALRGASSAEGELRIGRPTRSVSTGGRRSVRRSLGGALARRLVETARAERATLASWCALAWGLVLARYADCDDVVFAITMAQRPEDVPRVEEIVGALFNTVPLLASMREAEPVRAALSALKDRVLKHQEHANLPPAEIQRASGLRSDAAQIQTCMRVQTLPPVDLRLPDGLRLGDASLVDLWHYAACLVVEPRDGGLECRIDFDPHRYSDDAMQRTLGHFERALDRMSADLSAALGTIDVLTEEERATFATWHQTPYPPGYDTAIETIEEAADRYADRVTAEYEGRKYTARELMVLAEQRAAVLRARGVGTESVVLIEPSTRFIELFTLALGAWKAGGAAWLREGRAPPERLRLLVQELGVGLYVGSKAQAEALGISSSMTLDEVAAAANAEPGVPTRHHPHPASAAIVMLTSGSSGVPSAVVHTQESSAAFGRFAEAVGHEPGEGERFLPGEPFTGFLTALRRGATALAMTLGAPWDPEDFTRFVNEQRIRYFTLSASHLSTLDPDRMPELRMFSVGGEAFPATLAHKWRKHTITQQYMMTESSSGGTRGIIGPEYATEPNVGKAVPGRRIYVLDSRLRTVPVGVAGEIYFGGPGLARGYAGLPARTAERFLPDPFASGRGAQMYRTGDLGMHYADGRLAVLGRHDRQVKIRGFRVELEDIESRLHKLPRVQWAAVLQLPHPKLGPVLVAYVQPKRGDTIDVAELRRLVSEQLPDYMRPAFYVVMAALPVTADGNIKLQRKALPEPDWSVLNEEHEEQPHAGVERAVANLFVELLGVSAPGRNDRFFDLGGHSLLATQLVSRVRDELGVELPIRAVFEGPSIADLAARIADAQASATPRLEVVSRAPRPPLSFAQERLWFLEGFEADSAGAYHMPAAVRLTGKLDVEALRRGLDEVVRRHEILRTTFAIHDGQPYQRVHAAMPCSLSVEPFAGSDLMARLFEEWNRPFDRMNGPLFRVTLLRVDAEEHVLSVTMHHIISDGWSAGVFVRELAALYEAFLAGKPSPLQELPLQYADYAAWQRSWLQGEALDQELSYWRQQLSGAPAVVDLPTDRPRRAVQRFVGGRVPVKISPEQTHALRQMARRESATLYMVLLAGWQVLLARYSGQTDIVVGFAIANRTRSELEGLIGYFSNTLALRTDLSGEPTFREVLDRVKRTTLDAYAHQDLPFERIVEAVNPPRSLSYTPIFQVMFIMHDQPIGKLTLPQLKIEELMPERTTARFELVANVFENDGGLTALLEYNTDLFDPSTIEALGAFYVAVLDRMHAELR